VFRLTITTTVEQLLVTRSGNRSPVLPQRSHPNFANTSSPELTGAVTTADLPEQVKRIRAQQSNFPNWQIGQIPASAPSATTSRAASSQTCHRNALERLAGCCFIHYQLW